MHTGISDPLYNVPVAPTFRIGSRGFRKYNNARVIHPGLDSGSCHARTLTVPQRRLGIVARPYSVSNVSASINSRALPMYIERAATNSWANDLPSIRYAHTPQGQRSKDAPSPLVSGRIIGPPLESVCTGYELTHPFKHTGYFFRSNAITSALLALKPLKNGIHWPPHDRLDLIMRGLEHLELLEVQWFPAPPTPPS